MYGRAEGGELGAYAGGTLPRRVDDDKVGILDLEGGVFVSGDCITGRSPGFDVGPGPVSGDGSEDLLDMDGLIPGYCILQRSVFTLDVDNLKLGWCG